MHSCAHAARARNCPRQSFATRRWGRSQQPAKLGLQRRQDLGRWRKPGVEHVRIDDFVPPLQPLEIGPDGVEKRPAVKAFRRRVKGEFQPPVNHAAKSVQQRRVSGCDFPQMVHLGAHQLEAHGAGTDFPAVRLQSHFSVQLQNLPPPDADDARAAVVVHPAKSGIHEQKRQRLSAMRLEDGEQPHFKKPVVERKRQFQRAEHICQSNNGQSRAA